ncbi:MAG: PepSY domain-containing protein [Planctomycetes bacterium]|nr:PepSY domain-containing protein [Planctomycetota bacterium]
MKAPNVVPWMRRAHLYAGLFLAPWVLLYGLSGLVFNHGDWFADADARPRPWTSEPAALAQHLDANELARRVVAALDGLARTEDAPSVWRLAAGSAPSFQGEIVVQGEDEQGGTVLLWLDPASDEGASRRTPPAITPETHALDLDVGAARHAAQELLVARASAAQPELGGVRFGAAQLPALHLELERDGERRSASYDPQGGVLTLSDPSASRSLRPSEFLTRLHLSHGYPSGGPAQTLTSTRALFVDAVACALCFWAVSGLVMWWPLKRHRRPGGCVIVASLVLVAIVWRGMYGLFVG